MQAFVLSSVGSVVGIPLGGYFADKFGRKPSYFAALIFYIGVGTVSCFVPSFVPFVVLVCIQNVASGPMYQLPYMIGVEILEPGARATFAVLVTISYTLGGVVFTGLGTVPYA